MTTTTQTLPCYAKINLFLEIQDKRPDGYHNLGTLFQTIGCCDQLKGESCDSIELICPPGITADPEQNLIIKAARILQSNFTDRLNHNQGIRFTLEKNLPSGAGLGGGSSNAAAALHLCNTIWKLGLTTQELLPFAAKLGADVPFFLNGGTDFGEGIGEKLSPAPEPFPFHVVIGTPKCHVETGWAYQLLAKSLDSKKNWAKFKALYFTYCEDEKFYQILRNDFDLPIRENFPLIQSLFAEMETFKPIKTLLSGSGASLFSLFIEKKDADSCLKSIESSCRFSCVTQFIT